MSVARITRDERETLEALAEDSFNAGVPRGHLEKLARLDLIEPCGAGVCMTLKGRSILSNN
jgi:hypothetical protein